MPRVSVYCRPCGFKVERVILLAKRTREDDIFGRGRSNSQGSMFGERAVLPFNVKRLDP